ncbi:hypothetical protein N6H18_03110 [Reichenbachiella agarivorans]|uniref:Uncharacterized protein n=1 Tax=Reichenbachiella agarivorans TaxID=2979464 RepID=A0ABY6CRH0_9BACT|nr:hypothetical protein [Reichenbachiella agarivorans]UXP32944.1 hypothetical protein N6H18_03110 [Reichenbachiella agarivorans]
MNLIDKNILLISPEPWDHIFVSKHHYARHLAERGNRVVFANPPQDKWSVHSTGIDNLKVLNYPKFLKGLRKLPSFVSRRLIKHKLQQIEKHCGLTFDIIWSFDNSVFFDFTLLDTYNISHIVDLNQDFETKKAAQTADICFYTTQHIGDRLLHFNTNAHFINHGYNAKPSSNPKILPGEHSTKVLYAGNLNMPYLDWQHMQDAILKNPEADFIFLGPLDKEQINQNPTWQSLTELFHHDRVFFLGKVLADELPSYYAAADILTICYQDKHHEDQANPHKMMEYLGTGKMIAATYTGTFAQYKSPIIAMCTQNASFAEQIRKCITHIKEWNDQSWQQKRKAIAQDNSYNRQIERIENKISNHA